MDVGKTLQDARVANGVSLDTVARETNIRKIYLEAIEKNEFAALSGEVFVKGVIRTYGNYLGLDGAQLVEEYKAERDGNAPASDRNTIRESQHVKVRPTFKSNRDIGSGTDNGGRRLFVVGCVIAALLLAAGGFYFYRTQTAQGKETSLFSGFSIFNGANDKAAPGEKGKAGKTDNVSAALNKSETKPDEINSVKNKEAKITTQSGAGGANQSAVLPNANVAAVNSAQDPSAKTTALQDGATDLVLTSNGKCWLRVTEQNGKVLYEGNLLKGESRHFTSNATIMVRFGNLQDMTIEHNHIRLPREETMEPVTRVYAPAGKEPK